MKMRGHSARRARVSRKHRRLIEMDAEIRRWEAEVEAIMEMITDRFVRAFLGAAAHGWSQEGRR